MLLIYGAGGHARSVVDVAIVNGINQIEFIDDRAQPKETIFNFPVLKHSRHKNANYIVAIGDNKKRSEVFLKNGLDKVISLIANDAYLGKMTKLGKGVFVGHQVYLGPNVIIGNNTIINTRCLIEHDCSVGSNSHISINATLAGKVRIGNFVMIGAGAIVIDGITICDHTVVGAGAIVVEDIIIPGTYLGIPAKKIIRT